MEFVVATAADDLVSAFTAADEIVAAAGIDVIVAGARPDLVDLPSRPDHVVATAGDVNRRPVLRVGAHDVGAHGPVDDVTLEDVVAVPVLRFSAAGRARFVFRVGRHFRDRPFRRRGLGGFNRFGFVAELVFGIDPDRVRPHHLFPGELDSPIEAARAGIWGAFAGAILGVDNFFVDRDLDRRDPRLFAVAGARRFAEPNVDFEVDTGDFGVDRRSSHVGLRRFTGFGFFRFFGVFRSFGSFDRGFHIFFDFRPAQRPFVEPDLVDLAVERRVGVGSDTDVQRAFFCSRGRTRLRADEFAVHEEAQQFAVVGHR